VLPGRRKNDDSVGTTATHTRIAPCLILLDRTGLRWSGSDWTRLSSRVDAVLLLHLMRGKRASADGTRCPQVVT
jgi:hypothetical protein